MADRITDYLFTPTDVWQIFRQASWKNLLGLAFMLAGAIGLKAGLNLSWEIVIFAEFIFFLFYWQKSYRLPLALAIFYLLLIPVFLVLGNSFWPAAADMSKKFALWAFYLLAIGGLMQAWEYISRPAGPLLKDRTNKHAFPAGHRQQTKPAFHAPAKSVRRSVKTVYRKKTARPPIRRTVKMDGIITVRKTA